MEKISAISEPTSIHKKKNRNRSTIVCTNCKKRKTKCDKKQPCSKCIASGRQDSCVYLDHIQTPFDPNYQQSILRQTNNTSVIHTTNNNKSLNTTHSEQKNISSPPVNFIINNNNSAQLDVLSDQASNSSLSPPTIKFENSTMPAASLKYSYHISTPQNYSIFQHRTSKGTIASPLPPPPHPSPPSLNMDCKTHNQKINNDNFTPDSLNIVTLIDKINRLPPCEQMEARTSLNRLLQLYKTANLDSYNPLLDQKVWFLTKNGNTSLRSNTIVCPLIYPSSLWGNMDFLTIATELFQPLLNLYFNKWKKVKQITNIITDMNYNINLKEIYPILNNLKSYFLNNLDAIIERFNYFKNTLNSLLFHDFIPIEIVDYLLDNFLTYDQLILVQVEDNFFEISLIATIINLCFSYEKFFNFNYTFNNRIDMNKISVILMNYINYKQDKNILGVINVIITTWTTLYLNNDSFAGISGEYVYSIFRKQLDILFTMGYHLPPEGKNENEFITDINKKLKISQSSIWKLWNHIQFLDAFLSIRLGTPLLIDYTYCEEYHIFNENDKLEQLNKELVYLLREFSYHLNSKEKSNYRIFINLEKKFNSLFTKMDYFEQSFDNPYCEFVTLHNFQQVELKMEIMRGWFVINSLLTVCLRNDKLNEIFGNNYQYIDPVFFEEVQKMREIYKFKTYLIFLMSLKFIKSLSENKQINQSIVLSFRRNLLPWFTFPSLCVLDFILSDYSITNNINFKFFEMNIKDIENIVIDENRLFQIIESNRSFNFNLGEYNGLINLITQVYEASKNNKILSSSLDFFIKSKVLALTVYILLIFNKFHKLKSRFELNLYNIISSVVKIIMKTLQQKKPNSGNSLLKLLLNEDNYEMPNSYRSPLSLTPPLSSSSSLPPVSPSTMNSTHKKLPPKEIIEMIRLFINDERFTSVITQFDHDLKNFSMAPYNDL